MTTNIKNKRILWLINHTTLREFEVPLLVSLGYEVYLPKHLPSDEANRSASIDYSYDNALTIPEDELTVLNNHDFYSGIICSQIADIINTRFNTVIFAFFPNLFEQLVKNFQGNLLLRAFGLNGDASYTGIIKQVFPKDFLSRVEAIEDRFWFAQSYPNLSEVETGALKRKALTLPLGLPESFFSHANSWIGNNRNILFVCPRIASSPNYYGLIYHNFKKHLGALPHIIAGAQPLPIDDPAVKGFQSRNQLDEWLRTCKAMFYHSQEPRHLHYHPLEAIAFGMPLIYLRGGILEQLGEKNQPGACVDFKEAKRKLEAVLNDDRNFIQELLFSQTKILQHFQMNTCRKIWMTSFPEITQTVTTKIQPKRLTIAVLLPVPYRGGSLRAAKSVAKMLILGSKNAKREIKVIFSCVANYYDLPIDFSDLIEMGVEIRETNWEHISNNKLQNTGVCSSALLNEKNFLQPTDNLCNFNDCDFWLQISDRTDPPLAPLKPYGVIVYDYIQRYVPELFANHVEKAFWKTVRNASFVGVTTPQTRIDAIQYAGVRANKVTLLPMEFSPIEVVPQIDSSNQDCYFLWTTNMSIHKNHLRAFQALEIYYKKYQGKLDCFVTGVDTLKLLNGKTKVEYQEKVQSYLHNNPLLLEKLKILGNLPDKEFTYVLSKAKFLWHPTLIDNGTFSVIEAAYHNVPSLSSDYPQMRYIDNMFNLNMLFMNAQNAEDIAKHLLQMEQQHFERRALLPDKNYLTQLSYANQAPKFWEAIEKWL